MKFTLFVNKYMDNMIVNWDSTYTSPTTTTTTLNSVIDQVVITDRGLLLIQQQQCYKWLGKVNFVNLGVG